MTQDQQDQARDPGYARGEVVADDETEFTNEQSKPMTRFQKVASALRGETPDRADPGEVDQGQVAHAQPVSERPVSDLPTPDQAMIGQTAMDQEERAGVTNPDEGATGGAVGAPATLPGEMAGQAAPNDMGQQDPSMTRSDTYGTARTDTGGPTATPHTDYGVQGGTAAGYGSQADTATEGPAVTGDSPAATGADTAEARAAGRHGVDAEDAGLRPGEATERLGDFGDIAFGNLLPDAEMYAAQWDQIQLRFVDDPQGSVTEAADVISQVTMKLEAAIQERQRAIQERQLAIQERASALRGRWGEGSNADTETLRETLRMYRAFMDQLVGPTP
jgi:hypothetical protein